MVIPYSTVAAAHPPITIRVTCQGKPAVAVIDQVRAIANERLVERIEVAPEEQLAAVTEALAIVLEFG